MSKTDSEAQGMTDGEIVALFWSRDETAIAETDKKYGKDLLRIARNLIADENDCRECQNDTYYALWEQIPPARPARLFSYAAKVLRGITVNRYYHDKRKRTVPSELTVSMADCEELFSSSETTEDALDERELGRLINAFLAGLTARRRRIFVGRFWYAEPVKDIAARIGTSEWLVYKELSKLKKELKQFLIAEGITI